MTLEAHQIMDMYDYVLSVRNEIAALPAKRKSQAKQESEKLFIGDGGNPRQRVPADRLGLVQVATPFYQRGGTGAGE